MVYFIRCVETGRIKIGLSSSVENRFNDLRSMSPTTLELIHVIDGGKDEEKQLHKRFEQWRIKKENGQYKEWFEPNQELDAYLQAAKRAKSERQRRIRDLRELWKKHSDAFMKDPIIKNANGELLINPLARSIRSIQAQLKALESRTP